MSYKSIMKIAFSGSMGVGKDTAVDYLINKYGGQRIAFSDPLYDIMYYSQKRCGFRQEKDRKFLQWIGTEWGRSIDENVWIRLAINRVNDLNTNNVYITDVRFPNEFQAVKENGFICIKITRDKVNKERVGNGSCNHESEQSLSDINDWDAIVHNNDTVADFYKRLEQTISNLTCSHQ